MMMMMNNHFLISNFRLDVGRCPPQSTSLLRPAPTLSPSFHLAPAIFEPNLFPYKHSNILKTSHSSYLSAYEGGTGCSETSACRIQTPGNYQEENIEHSEHGESLKSRIFVKMLWRFSKKLLLQFTRSFLETVSRFALISIHFAVYYYFRS